MVWMHSNGDCTTVRYHTKISESCQKNCVFRISLGLSTQIMDFKYKQAYKMIEIGVLVWKSKNMNSYRPFFSFCCDSRMLETKWWNHVSYGFSYFECQKMLGLYGGRWPKILHYRSIPCLNTLVGSVRYLITLLKYSLFLTMLSFTQPFHIAEPDPILTHCWSIPYPITLLSNSQRLILCWAIPYLNTLLRYSLS